MDASTNPANSSTPKYFGGDVVPAKDAIDEDDLALGWECANPALQIESWGTESAAQPLQPAY